MKSNRLERVNLALEKLGLSAASGILLALPFAFPVLAPIHFVALLPWIVLFVHPRYRAHAAYVLPGAYIYLALSLRPMSRLHPVIPLFLSMFFFAIYALFPILLKALSRRRRVVLSLIVPISWVLTEAVRSYAWWKQLTLCQLGTSQFRWTELIQIADFTGVYGVSFLIAAFNGVLADLFLTAQWRRRLASIALVAAWFGGALIYGEARVHDRGVRPGPRLALIQPNERHAFLREDNRELMPRTIAFTREQVAPGTVDLIVWPENAVDDALNVKPQYVEQLGALAREKRSHLLVGAFTKVPGGYYTSAYLFSPEGVISGRADKVHMIFWSEYMPFNRLLTRWPRVREAHYRFARGTLGWAGAGVPVKEVTILQLPDGNRFAVPICFETSNSTVWRSAARRRAGFLINITGEGILGPAMYTHFLAHASFRAVENRIGVVRAANNGMSAFVDPNGRIYNVLRGTPGGAFYGERGTLVDTVRVHSRHNLTFYTRYGDLFVLACALAAAVLLIPAGALRRRVSELPRTPAPSHSARQAGSS